MQQLNTQVPKMQGIPLSSVPNIQPVSVSGSKFQYVRLVTNPAAHTQTTLGKSSVEVCPIDYLLRKSSNQSFITKS